MSHQRKMPNLEKKRERSAALYIREEGTLRNGYCAMTLINHVMSVIQQHCMRFVVLSMAFIEY